MNEEQVFRKLAARARIEDPPQVDVADRVMAILRSRIEEQLPTVGPLAWVAGCSSAAAFLMVSLLYVAWDALTDPVMQMLCALTWEIL